MLRYPLSIVLIAFSSHAASAEGYWSLPQYIEGAILAASALYDAEPEYDPHKPVVIDDRAPELTALYDGMDERLAPMRIYTFSAKPEEANDITKIPTTFLPGSAEDMIVGLIRRFEAGKKGYDSVWNGSRHPLPQKPSEMTVCQVRDWQLAARKVQKSTAIGMYQIVGGTYRRVIEQMQLPCDLKFDAKTQDRIGLALLYGRGWAEFKAGTMNVEDFAYELAGEWAAFPAPYGEHKGMSRHRGVAGNKHLIALPEYLAYLQEIRRKIGSDDATSTEEQLDLVVSDASNLETIALLDAGDAAEAPPALTDTSDGAKHFEVVELNSTSSSGEEKPSDALIETAAVDGDRRWKIMTFRP